MIAARRGPSESVWAQTGVETAQPNARVRLNRALSSPTPAPHPAGLRYLADQLSAVLDFAAEVQQMVLEELTAPILTPIRLS